MCVDRNWTCAYSLRNRKPGPRKGSRQMHKLNLQYRLNRIEDLLHQGRLSEEDISQGPPLEVQQEVQHDMLFQHGQSPAARPDSSQGEEPEPQPELEPSPCDGDASWPSKIEPIMDAINWTRYLKPVSHTAELGTSRHHSLPGYVEMSGYDSSLTPSLERHLISLYFACVSLPVPIFSKAKFFQEYEAGCVPRFLLSAMFALSSRFCMPSKVLCFGSQNPTLTGQHFSRKTAAELGHITKTNQAISMNEVKATYLLAVYHYTNLSLREAWEQCSRAISMAYMLRLHQIDNPNADPALSSSVLDKEEKRCMWWAIYTLDCFSCLVSFIPSGIDELSLATSIPAALLSETPASSLGPATLDQARLPDYEMDWSWCVLQDSSSGGAKLQAALIFAHSLARETSHLRRVAHENPRCNLQDQLKCLQQKWNSIFTVLPSWFFLPARHERDRTAKGHRQRLEVLNVCYITGAMASVPPLSADLRWPIGQWQDSSTMEGRWKTCITYILNIVAAYREWAPEYFDKADPIMLPITWTAGSLLALELMNEALVDATEKLALLDALDAAMASLQKPSRYWGIASILLRSLEDLRGKAWMKLNLQAIFQLAIGVWSPLMPDMPKGSRTTPEPFIPAAPESSTMSENADRSLDLASLAWAPDELLSTLEWFGSGQDTEVPLL
ncbi:hypothetical protein NW756_006243 [Fusarium oxysporum]|nr:hypothetical protein NW753_008028 [Fusarium oxysporum]KAJ4049612.1 hypothetical protein NW763_008910 [Fusarium oxysporum]KAJ4089907.1 hypothetical protein NW756_006243 [Fusarium oxysporum]KAJ4113091.1 hypothetical protein NW769_006122 [Fusarium oxysporum]KAJ4235382.1 hypothetical protein NW760_004922 [Fusarium oxysporum]